MEVGVASTQSPDIQSYVPTADNFHFCDEGGIPDLHVAHERVFQCSAYRGRLVVIKVPGSKMLEYDRHFELCQVEVYGMCDYL